METSEQERHIPASALPESNTPAELAAQGQSEQPPEAAASGLPEFSEAATEPESPSPFAQELIKLRDWLLASRASEGVNPERLLDGMDRKFQILLKREGFTLLEETGVFQRERQEILETTPTGNPDLNDHVCATVRSGYLFHDTLFRPQQVVIYTYDPALPKPS